MVVELGIEIQRGNAMITISLCMIVKNEERILQRCLDSICDLVEEVIIVDTGSTDTTKEIAARYTDNIYDFSWIDDFSAARNFAFSKATQEYIYTADADEVLSEENRHRFRQLKETLLAEIEIVQMKYENQLRFKTVYNFDEEYRPKLFKRMRTFEWIDPIHETIRIEPVVYDSDIVITHLPEESHAGRDLAVFLRQLRAGRDLSERLWNMYARELLQAGAEEDFRKALPYFDKRASQGDLAGEAMGEACCVIAHAARLQKDLKLFFKYTSKVIAQEACAEICLELGHYYWEQEDLEEAAIWYYNAVYETAPILVLSTREEALQGLIGCYERMGDGQQAEVYRQELAHGYGKKDRRQE